MQLRPRQIEFVSKCCEALKEKGNTIGVAPTGAGKTVMMAGTAEKLRAEQGVKRGLVIQHSDELTEQNRKTFYRMNKSVKTDLFNADRKVFVDNGWTFAMIQTLGRESNLSKMPILDALFIDEAHHSAAPTYNRVIERAKAANPKLKLFGVTATPNRGDKKALLGIFDNCADQIQIQELIKTGFLVRPRTFVIDIGTQEALRGVKKLASDFNMAEVESIMDKDVHNERIVEEWSKIAGDRRTVVFASTVNHANHVASAFERSGYKCAVVWGDMPETDRKATLAAFDKGQTQVLVNVAVLTEGWDCQPVSCVVLLRPSSYKSTMVQMIGRGLRKVDPELYPGIVKDDCIVIDFGTSVLLHGSLETAVDLAQSGTKKCPECGSTIPANATECPICGHEFPKQEAMTKICDNCGGENPLSVRACVHCGAEFPRDGKETISDFILTEIDLLQQSPFRWETLFDGAAMVASAFDAWAAIVSYYGRWYAIGGSKERGVKVLGSSDDRIVSLATADDFMRDNGDDEAARKTKRWLSLPVSEGQMNVLKMDPVAMTMTTRYQAACLITWKFNENAIRHVLQSQQRALAA